MFLPGPTAAAKQLFSGKTTVTMLAKIIQPYINADEIKKNLLCEDLEAAKIAEGLREKALAQKQSFTFETVLSTRRNLDLFAAPRQRTGLFYKVHLCFNG